MELSILLLKQLIIMFAYALIGYFLAKRKLITNKGCIEMVNLLLYIVIPFTVLNSFLVEVTPEKTTNLIYSIFFSLLSFVIAILLSYKIYGSKHRVENFSSTFSNAGFIGIPLVEATLGSEAVFYIASYVAFLNIFQWIYGAFIMSGDKRMISFKMIAKNAVLIFFICGIILYFSNCTNLYYIKNIAGSIAKMNSPLAMIIIGIYFSQVSLKNMILRKSTYLCSMVRLLLIPLISMIMIVFIPYGDENLKLAIIIVMAAPVGANVAMFAQKFNQDHTYAVEIVVLSTILSSLTLPCMIYFAQACI